MKKPAAARSDDARDDPPLDRHIANTNAEIAVTAAARTAMRPANPPMRYVTSRTTWASHCWSTHASPTAVNVNMSRLGIAPVVRISCPSRR